VTGVTFMIVKTEKCIYEAEVSPKFVRKQVSIIETSFELIFNFANQ
jgi:hypothetical protein